MGITHAKVSAKSDGGDTTLVRPSDWNATHVDSNAVYAKATFGCVADGSTDDTAVLQAGLDAMVDYVGATLYFEPGVYNIPDGVTVNKRGVRLIGLGHRANGPGDPGTTVGVVLKNSTAASWALTIAGDPDDNNYEGAHVEGLSFSGDTDCAGGLLFNRSYGVIDRCGAHGYLNGIGFKLMYADGGDADAAQNNEIIRCEARNCLIAYQIGQPDMEGSEFHVGAAVTMMLFCNSLGNTPGAGTGILVYDNSCQIFGGDIQGHTTGIRLAGNASVKGTTVIGTRFEGLTTDIDCTRNSGSGSSTSNFLCGSFRNVTIGPDNVGDIVIGGNGLIVTDNGTGTAIYNNGGYGGIQFWDDTSSGAPTGGHDGELRMKNGKLYYKTAGSWKALTGV